MYKYIILLQTAKSTALPIWSKILYLDVKKAH